jgi:hypothetical protein
LVEKKFWDKNSKAAFNKEFAVQLKNNCGYPGILLVFYNSFFYVRLVQLSVYT